MRLAAGTSVVLRPADPPVAFERLLVQWTAAGFEPAACRRALDAMIAERKLGDQLFCPDAIERGERPATDALLFDFFAPDRDWIWMVQSPARRAGIRMPVAAVPAVARLLRAIGPSRDAGALRAVAGPGLPPGLTELLCDGVEHATGPTPYGVWPALDGPGIYRREHASVIVRSRTTTLLVDPQGTNLGESANLGRYPAERAALDVDAVVITHHHNDHWHLPSILHVIGERDVPVIVPVTPRPNLLTGEAFAASLARAGVRAEALAWWTTLQVGDIAIDALPFFGEQPTCGAPGPAAGLRSWGNCYRFTTPDFSAILLVDSGVDPMGNMLEVVQRSAAERGPPDAILSNCRAFPEVINPGLAHYALALPFDRVRAAYRDRARFASMTLGESGVAEVCAAARARHFLPYAHMFGGIGVHADDQALDGVRRGLAERGAATRVVAWNPGDVARFDRGALTVARGPE